MIQRPKIIAVAGSLRKDSYNKKLVKIAAAGALKAGAEVTFVDLADYPLPLYDADLEEREGLPIKAKELKRLFVEHDGFLIASPEYNGTVSGVLKNTIDWVSRPEEDEPASLVAFRGKFAAVMSASPSMVGGIRGLAHLRDLLGYLYTLVVPEQVSVSMAHEAFNEDGQLKDPNRLEKALALGSALTEMLFKLNHD